MKVFFASLTDPSLEIDAWVPSVEQGGVLLAALAETYKEHAVIMRARLRKYQDYEERYIGSADDEAALKFLDRVLLMGSDEPIKGDAS
jgi:hypothetical protein